jgi:hypothetical protein
MDQKPDDETYSPAEAERRRDAITRAMIATPPAPHAPKAKRKPSRPKKTTRKAKKRA